MKIISILKSVAIILLTLCTFGVSTVSCSLEKETKLPELKKSVALFDNFIYKGNDDFYISNPLSGEDYLYNPILPGWHSDPSICTNENGDYFLVTSTFSYFPGVSLFHSRDLLNWKQIGHVLNRASQLVNMEGQHTNGGIFAPAISYNPFNKTYYMVTSNVGAGNFFVKTQNPFGDWSEPIMLPEVTGIDPSFFFDEDGKAYILNNDDAPDGKPEYNGHRTIRIQEFDTKTDKTTGSRKILINKGADPEENPIWIAGPHMYKVDGRYILIAAEGGTFGWHSEVVFSGDSPMGEFIPWKNNPILTQRHLDSGRPNAVTCAGHADLFQTTEGDWWAVFLACRPLNNKFENLGRETFIMPVKWSDDSFPYITQADDQIPMILKREGTKRDTIVTFGNFKENENFDSTALGVNWMTLRTPATNLYSLTETPGYLALKCANISTKEKKTPAFVCRRLQHHKFECSTRVLFEPSDNSEAAGLLLYKDETHQYFLAIEMNDSGKCISLYQIGESDFTLASQEIDKETKVIDLKITSKGTSYDFYFSKGGKWNLLAKNIDASYLSTTVAGGFTGTTIGMYATSQKK